MGNTDTLLSGEKKDQTLNTGSGKQVRASEEMLQATKEQQRRVQRDQYNITKKGSAAYHENAGMTGSIRANFLQNQVRRAIIDNLGRKRYEAFDNLKIKKAGEEAETGVKLHHAVGSRLALDGEDVIEFSMAGSGFRYPRMQHKDFMAWEGQDEYREEELKVHWYNRTRLLNWLPKVRTKKRIEEINALRLEKNRQIEEIYGKPVEDKIKGKKLHHLRKKESVNDKGAKKTRFSFCGPNAVNISKYSEDRLEEYILELGKSVLKSKFEDWDWLEDSELEKAKKVNIIVQGHSRGGVAAGLGAMRLKRWTADRYPRFLNKVHFELLQYDPVAGGIENFGNNAKIDHAPKDVSSATKDKRYMSLGEEADTTVIYSMHTQHPVAFTPQLVKNPKRIILSMYDHGVGLFKSDDSQDGEKTRATYLAEKGGRVESFRSTGLNELDEGVYMLDDQNNLIRLKSLEEYDAIAKPLLKGAKSQSARHEVVREAVKTWFKSNGEQLSEGGLCEEQKKPEENEQRKELKKPEAEEIKEGSKGAEAKEQSKELKETAPYEIPAELSGAYKEKEKLGKMPKDTKEQQLQYRKKEEKYLTAKRSGMKAYVVRLAKEKGGYITAPRKEYLFLLSDLSYQLELNGTEVGGDQEIITELLGKLKGHPCRKDFESFIPGFMQKELYAGSEQKLNAILGQYEKREAPEAEKVKKTELKELKEIPFKIHEASMREKGMDAAYEEQPAGSNNCYCCTGTAMLKQFTARKLGKDITEGKPDQFEMRSFRPDIKKYDEALSRILDREEYDRLVLELDRYAGETRKETGSIFDMGDFLFEKLSENKIDNVMLNRAVMEIPKSDKTDERSEKKCQNMKAYLADKLNDIISSGSIAGVLLNEANGNSHYRTVTGIKGEILTVYDSIGYSLKGKAQEIKIDEFLKRGSRVEINWLSDKKPPEELAKEYSDLKYDAVNKTLSTGEPSYEVLSQTGALYHTRGISVMKKPGEMEEGMEDIIEMAYISDPAYKPLKVKMDECVREARDNQTVYERKRLEEEEARKKEEKKKQEKKVQQKASKDKKSEEKDENADASLDRKITELFHELTNKIRDPYYDRDNDIELTDEIWSRLRMRSSEDSVSLKHLRSAVENVKKLTARLGSKRNVKNRPNADTVMAAMTRLSEAAEVFYDEHRGHQYTERGKQHRQACDMIREITKEFYDRLDIAMGGQGYGNIAAKNITEDFSVKEGVTSGEKMKELAGIYGKWKKHFSRQEGMERAKLSDRAKLFAPYERYIEIYKASHRVKDWPKEIEEVIRAASYFKVQNMVVTRFEESRGGFSDPLVSLAAKHVEEMELKDRSGRSLPNKEADKGLSPEQLKALDAIDQWFIRNYNNGGIAWSMTGVRNHHGEIVRNLLGKTKRERLFIYYLIETRKRKSPELYDVFASQGYIPDLNKFKNRMLASRFKVMSHVLGGYVYMGKVTEAMQINRDYSSVIADCEKLDMKPRKLSEEELTELKKQKDKYRFYMLVKTFQSTKAFRDAALLSGDAAGDDAQVEAKKKVFLEDLAELIKADEAVGEAIRYGESLGEIKTDEKGVKNVKGSEKYYSVKNRNVLDAADNTGTYVAAGSNVAAKADMAVNPAILFANAARSGVGAIKGTPYKPIKWRLKDSSLMKTKLYAGSITSSTISALGSVLGACYGIYNLTQNWDNMHAFDKACGIAGILQSAAATGATVVNGIETGKQYADLAAKAIEGNPVTSDVVKGLGIASAGITTAINMYTAVSGKLDEKNSDNAKEFLKNRVHSRYMERLKLMAESPEERKLREGSETSEEKTRREKEFIRDRYERNMLKLSKNISSRKGTYAGIQAVGSMISVAGFIVPVAGTFVGFGGTAVTMAAGTLSSMSLTGIREQMFDTYFQLDSFVSDAVDELKSRGETVYNMDEFKIRMRRVLAAAAGYADVISACDQIAKKYADLICTGLYGPVEDRASGEVRSAYIQLIKSFGLPYDEKKRIPDASLLARRMNGR